MIEQNCLAFGRVTKTSKMLDNKNMLGKQIAYKTYIYCGLMTDRVLSLSTKELPAVLTNDILPPLTPIGAESSPTFFLPLDLSFCVVCCQPWWRGKPGGFRETPYKVQMMGIFLALQVV